MKKGISKPILAIVFAGMALVAFVVWREIWPGGKIDLSEPAASTAQAEGEPEPLSISGNLFAGMVQPGFTSPEGARTAYQTRAQQHHAVAVNLDSSFLVDSVAPGTYALTLNAYPPRSSPFCPGQTPPTATGRATITVPESANPLMPIDMGEIVLSPPKNSPWE